MEIEIKAVTLLVACVSRGSPSGRTPFPHPPAHTAPHNPTLPRVVFSSSSSISRCVGAVGFDDEQARGAPLQELGVRSWPRRGTRTVSSAAVDVVALDVVLESHPPDLQNRAAVYAVASGPKHSTGLGGDGASPGCRQHTNIMPRMGSLRCSRADCLCHSFAFVSCVRIWDNYRPQCRPRRTQLLLISWSPLGALWRCGGAFPQPDRRCF